MHSSPPAATGVNRQNVEGVVEDVLLRQGVEEVLCLLIRGDELLPVLRVRQVNHPGGVLRNNLVALGIAEDCRDHGQVLLHRCLLDGLALVGAFPQLDQHILQGHGPQFPQLDGPNVGVDPLQHPPVAGQSAGSVLHLTLQPPGGVSFKGGVPVLGETRFHQAFQLLGFVGNVLADAPGLHRIRDGNGLGFADFLAVRAVAVADGDLEFAVSKFLDACQISSPFSEIGRTVSVISLPTQRFVKGKQAVGLSDFFDALPSQA